MIIVKRILILWLILWLLPLVSPGNTQVFSVCWNRNRTTKQFPSDRHCYSQRGILYYSTPREESFTILLPERNPLLFYSWHRWCCGDAETIKRRQAETVNTNTHTSSSHRRGTLKGVAKKATFKRLESDSKVTFWWFDSWTPFTPNLPTNIVPTNIAWLKLSGKSPMGLRIPPRWIKIMLESNPLKPTTWVARLGVACPFCGTVNTTVLPLSEDCPFNKLFIIIMIMIMMMIRIIIIQLINNNSR